MSVTALLSILVGVMTAAMTIDKFLHTFGLHKLLSAQLRNAADAAVERAKLTPGTADDNIATAAQGVAHAVADAVDRGDEAKVIELAKDFAAKRTAPK